MVLAQVKEHVMIQLECVNVMKDSRVTIVKVSCDKNSQVDMIKSYSLFLFTEINCLGDGLCSGQGTCDVTTGMCTCNEGFNGDSCESK